MVTYAEQTGLTSTVNVRKSEFTLGVAWCWGVWSFFVDFMGRFWPWIVCRGGLNHRIEPLSSTVPRSMDKPTASPPF